MQQLRRLLRRLAGLLNRRRRDSDIAEEIQSHLELHVSENIRNGLSPENARRQALIKLGGIDATKERLRDTIGIPLLETLIQDVRFGIRVIRRSPGFSAVAVLTLALGIGANTAIFSIVNAVLLRPLPFPEPDRLVMVWATDERTGRNEDVTSYPNFADWMSQSRSFESMGAFTTRGATVTGPGDAAEAVAAIQVTPGFFEMLKAPPQLGRTFTASEGESGGPDVALISDSFWKTRFARAPNVLDQIIQVNEQSYKIIGVLPARFSFGTPEGKPQEICTPLVRDPNRGHGFLVVVGRMKPRVSIREAQAEMAAITGRLAAAFPKINKGVGANCESVIDATVGNAKAGLWILLGVTLLVLLIACANVTNLMLSRAASRRSEIAVRTALGAGRRRLAQQLLVESTMLGLAGGALGQAVATWGSGLLVVLLSSNFRIPRIQSTGTDFSVVVFTLVLSIATGVVFGVVPALTASSSNLNATLNEAGRATTESPRGRRLRGGLVVLETALALVLLSGAGLLLKGFLTLRSTAPGFHSQNLVSVDFSLPRRKYSDMTARHRFFDDILSSISSAPGVSSAALVADLPLGGGQDGMGFHIPGRPDPGPDTEFSSNFNIASAGYFRTMGIPLRAGREFTNQDGMSTPGVIVINQAAAGTFWPGEVAVGREILLPGPNDENIPLTIIGVAGDVRQSSLGRESQPEIFLDYTQAVQTWPWLALVVRTDGDPAAMLAGIKGIVQSVDPDVPVLRVLTMDQVLSGAVAEPRTYALLLGVFAMLALILASVGIYGVVAYTVSQRTHEIGVRMALGAERVDVLMMLLRQGLLFVIIGTMLGLAGSLAAARLLRHLMSTINPADWTTVGMTAAVLIIVAAVAVVVPSQRATMVAPTQALRCQ